ncbi:hypothetical protein HMPREF0281_01596 [Corynebacterium ammoniagenes DSM 20306]|uniref:Uncharacterized protein n=1 Tax=Corynebacterium ammoniagenes DSM 20306 TaxID=649754 RepID=A0ABN0AEE8_CORAM|nr:hypothetical protein HMPREF0281_01596 [Corynebacterium ammoniagenes DSM 20306]
MLGYIGGINHVKSIVAKRQGSSIAAHSLADGNARRRHFPGIRLHADVARTAGFKLGGKISWAPADIQNAGTAQGESEVVAEGIDKQSGVVRQTGIKNMRLGLLKPEGTQQLPSA